jgi:uncharacterized short protein YbdD (DUF466 family)
MTRAGTALLDLGRALRRWLRALSGDDAYERYCAHRGAVHPDEPPMSRRAFYQDALQRKWSGMSRCC